jgi:hypothetical protein
LTSLLHEEFEIRAIVQVELTLYLFCPFYSRFCKKYFRNARGINRTSIRFCTV